MFSCYDLGYNYKKILDTIIKLPKSIEEKINLKSFLFIISELKPNYELNKSFDTIYYQQKGGRFYYYLLSNLKNKKQLKSSKWWTDKYQKVVNLDINMLKIIIPKKPDEKKQSLRI
tara:strand:- start:503 stop:850 length:348 start_codon:yes stop_codon:yes gene_type:complete